jgi:hypothetical protein
VEKRKSTSGLGSVKFLSDNFTQQKDLFETQNTILFHTCDGISWHVLISDLSLHLCSKDCVFWEKFRKYISTQNGSFEKLMVTSESAPQELSNEWSCQYVSIILDVLGNFCVPPKVSNCP